MIVAASYKNRVLKIPVNAQSATLTFTESGVYGLNPYYVSSINGKSGVYYTVNGETIREDSPYTHANVESSASAFMRSVKSGDSIIVNGFNETTLIAYVLIWKVGNYVENK